MLRANDRKAGDKSVRPQASERNERIQKGKQTKTKQKENQRK